MEMNLPTANTGRRAHSNELESVLNALAEINVQLRHILQISKMVIVDLEMRSRVADAFEEMELESRKQSIGANMSRMEAAIGNMNLEISALLGRGPQKVRPAMSIERDVERSAGSFQIVSES